MTDTEAIRLLADRIVVRSIPESLSDTSSSELSELNSWRLFDAFFVKIDANTLPAVSSVELTRLIDDRMPRRADGLSPLSLYLGILRTIVGNEACENAGIYWNRHARDLVANSTHLSGFTKIDWGFDDLIVELSNVFSWKTQDLDSVIRRVKVGYCEAIDSVGQLVNYLWRVLSSSSDSIAPRFAIVQNTSGGEDENLAIRRSLVRVLVVLNIWNSMEIQDEANLDEMIRATYLKVNPHTWSAKSFVKNTRKVLDFELRYTFGVYPHKVRRLVFGDLAFGLPSHVSIFGDLIRMCSSLRANTQNVVRTHE
jgi:hypothetical protein